MDTITLLDGPRELCVHPRLPDGTRGRSRLPGHGRRVRPKAPGSRPQPEELWLASQPEPLPAYLEGLRPLGFRRFVYQVRLLYRLCHEYDPAELTRVLSRSINYGLYDAARLERMLLDELGARLFSPPRPPDQAWSGPLKPRSIGDVTPRSGSKSSTQGPSMQENTDGTSLQNTSGQDDAKEGEPRG